MKILAVIYNYYLSHLAIIHSGAVIAKLKSSVTLGIALTPFAFIINFFSDWIINIRMYITVVSIALVIDLMAGVIAHLFYFKDFSIKLLTLGFLTKSGCTFLGLLLFELFGILFIYHDVEQGSWLKLSLAITVFLYPAGSAFGNINVITGGKFPPTFLFDKIKNFQKNGNHQEFIKKETSPDEDT